MLTVGLLCKFNFPKDNFACNWLEDKLKKDKSVLGYWLKLSVFILHRNTAKHR
jgi:hypothetical protein